MARNATVVGLGVIGGSIARGLKRAHWRVTGVDIDRSNAELALALGYIDAVADFPPDGQAVVFVAVPPLKTSQVVRDIIATTEDCVVTDVASVKGRIAGEVSDPRFVPGHPMAGSEKSRLDGADPALFDGATWILTSTVETDEGALELVIQAVNDLGAQIRFMDPNDHDSLMAAVSHTPQLVAVSLVNAAFQGNASDLEEVARVAGPGFRDMTRIASSDPSIWVDICRINAPAIRKSLRDVVDRLEGLAAALDADEVEVLTSTLVEQFDRARHSRQQLPIRKERKVELICALEARPVETVLKAADQLGVNIEDWFVHGQQLHFSVRETDRPTIWGGLTTMGFKPALSK